MPLTEYAQLYIETPRPGLRIIRVAGRYDMAGAARVARLIDSQIGLTTASHLAVSQILVDLAEVTFFVPEALESLSRSRNSCREAGVGLHLTGSAGRMLVLPLTVRQALSGFAAFPTVAVALAALEPGRRADGVF